MTDPDYTVLTDYVTGSLVFVCLHCRAQFLHSMDLHTSHTPEARVQRIYEACAEMRRLHQCGQKVVAWRN